MAAGDTNSNGSVELPLGRTRTEQEEQKNRPDEWKIEQGLHAASLPILDQSGDQIRYVKPMEYEPWKDERAIRAVGNPEELFKEEREGWKGYIEWEAYPEKKAKAAKIMESQNFPPPPEFQLGPIPGTNPVLEGVRWKQWHSAVGGPLTDIPAISWDIVKKEKHEEMLHLLEFPYNGEAPKRLVTAKDIMPNSLHFVRNHGGIPVIDKDKYYFDLDGLVKETKRFTLDDLMDESKYPRMEQTVTIQCSGTRRIEQINQYSGEGDEMINAPWAEGAIGTAKYVGVSLKKVIKACGGLVYQGNHLEFYGADTYFKKNQVHNYLVSVPWSKVKANEVMLAWEMNGEPLPRIHGYPLRIVVMGYIGARSCKWLYRIKAIGPNPSPAPVQSQEYLYFNQQVGKHNQRMTDGIQIQEMPVSSAIMMPWTKQIVIHNGSIHCKGWAYSGGGRWPERVELSADGGFSWYACDIADMSPKRKFAWRTWEIDLPCQVEGWIEIVCRCWDNSLNTQPLNVRAAWNWGLHVTSSAHRISIYSVNKTRERTKARLEDFAKRGVSFAPLTVPTERAIQDFDEYTSWVNKHDPRDAENVYKEEDLFDD
ncbi:hypothetical protein LTR78_005354 [Recurvomyces mirabilis]|uniref:Sulfite oxidase n=1 Tax=Recurvomyces mirabilis TaxID=574656 RepID=A0AAE0WMU5_9PEZI|nr:hypothetical protein LTR78_005354 [Recurvomyces mirabilis]KAK5152739.1 hypothetical protein LTS14_008273 [Recurvomyces mirabilis]